MSSRNLHVCPPILPRSNVSHEEPHALIPVRHILSTCRKSDEQKHAERQEYNTRGGTSKSLVSRESMTRRRQAPSPEALRLSSWVHDSWGSVVSRRRRGSDCRVYGSLYHEYTGSLQTSNGSNNETARCLAPLSAVQICHGTLHHTVTSHTLLAEFCRGKCTVERPE